MQRICHAVNAKYPEMKFIGLCHAIAEMERDLPELLDTKFENIEYRAGGLNHISILVDVKYKDSQLDDYTLISQKALEYYNNYIIDFEKMNEQSTTPGAERGIFLKLFETYKKCRFYFSWSLFSRSNRRLSRRPKPCSTNYGNC
mgnify:CR=1 FL=1